MIKEEAFKEERNNQEEEEEGKEVEEEESIRLEKREEWAEDGK